MGSTEKWIGCRYVVLGLMFKFALGHMKSATLRPRKSETEFPFNQTLGPYNFSSSMNCGPSEIAPERTRRALQSKKSSFRNFKASEDHTLVMPARYATHIASNATQRR